MEGAADHCARLISCWRTGRGLRSKALRNQIEDARIGQIVEERRVKDRLQRRRLRIVAHRLEIRRGNANAVVAQVGSGADPILRARKGGKV